MEDREEKRGPRAVPPRSDDAPPAAATPSAAGVSWAWLKRHWKVGTFVLVVAGNALGVGGAYVRFDAQTTAMRESVADLKSRLDRMDTRLDRVDDHLAALPTRDDLAAKVELLTAEVHAADGDLGEKINDLDGRLSELEHRLPGVAHTPTGHGLVPMQPIEDLRADIRARVGRLHERQAQGARVAATAWNSSRPKPQYLVDAEDRLHDALAFASAMLAEQTPIADRTQERPVLWDISSRIAGHNEFIRECVSAVVAARRRAGDPIDPGPPSVEPP